MIDFLLFNLMFNVDVKISCLQISYSQEEMSHFKRATSLFMKASCFYVAILQRLRPHPENPVNILFQ